MRHLRGLGSFLPFLLATLPVLAPLACGKTDASPSDPGLPSGIFGGSGGAVEQPTLAGAPAMTDGGSPSTNVPMSICEGVPQGQLALLDDFEDDDSVAVPEVDREAYWFTIKDETAGTIVPDTQFLPVPGGAHGSKYAAHITASGFTTWGAGFSANISHFANQIRCPFNASKFSGLRFFARGSGQIRVELLIPEIVDQEYGGTCDSTKGEVCYDSHGAWVVLTPEWKAYSLPWSEFVQRNYGKQAAFHQDGIIGLQYGFEVANLPVDVWLDDISWEDGSPTPPLGAGGEGGASAGENGGAAGEGGMSSGGQGGA